MKWLVTGIAAIVGVVIAIAVVVTISSDGAGTTERADVQGQGGDGDPVAIDGAQLVRATDGLRVGVVVPTPTPGSYEYPTGDMVTEWAEPHPDVLVGGTDDEEVFTMWVFIFNYPDRCTDESCDLDDLAPDAAARGGAFQADGRIADGDELELFGSIRFGQVPSSGSMLENPLGAAVHIAIAPHGQALSGSDLQRQLNGPIGNPTLWWGATFAP